MELKSYVRQKAEKARKAAGSLALLSSETKNTALIRMADALVAQTEELISFNTRDLDEARKRGLSKALVDRLTLDPKRIKTMAAGLREVAELPDPVGEVVKTVQRPNGMRVERTRVPIGVIGMVYESRPNVTAETGIH